VRKLVSEEVLPDNVAAGIARVANLKSHKLVVAPSGRKTVIAQAGEIDLTHYYDPVDDVTIEVDHLTLQTNPAEDPSNQDPDLADLRAVLQRRLQDYVKSYYPGDNAAVGVFAVNGRINVVITGERINLKNFWSGKWTSNWNVTINDGNATITGDTKIHVHYFEDGNLQMQTSKAVPAASFAFNSDNTLFDKIASHIQVNETGLQSGLEEMYTNMNNETFRSLRRIMPVTRTKMDWNVNSTRMIRQVRK